MRGRGQAPHTGWRQAHSERSRVRVDFISGHECHSVSSVYQTAFCHLFMNSLTLVAKTVGCFPDPHGAPSQLL